MSAKKLLAVCSIGGALLMSGCALQRGNERMSDAHGRQHGDMARMCAMHKQMTAGKSPAEQRAAIEAHITSMHGAASPDMVAHHQKMMEMHCGNGAGGPQMK